MGSSQTVMIAKAWGWLSDHLETPECAGAEAEVALEARVASVSE